MKTLLTIDWDYFVPEDPEWDIGHQENLMFLHQLWLTRGSLMEKFKTTGEEIHFVEDLLPELDLTDTPIYVSESHVFAYELAKQAEHVILVDAHHDCWEGADLDKTPGIGCDNWLREWLRRKGSRTATWLKPANTKMEFNLSEFDPVSKRITILNDVFKLAVLRKDDLVGIHICRSGCWTPPWLDANFREFVGSFDSKNVTVMPKETIDTAWDPMKFRWTLDDYKKAREMALAIEVAKDRVMTEMAERQSKKGEIFVG